MKKASLVIPAFQPDETLIELVRTIKRVQVQLPIIVVDDGSHRDVDTIFKQIEDLGAIVLRHPVNRGKGAALITAFEYWKTTFSESQLGVVTADADGQHSVEDILSIIEKLSSAPHELHLGSRQFDKSVPVPWKSLIGNKFSAQIFSLLTNQSLGDTQTGLRGIGKPLLEIMLRSSCTGYEFELEMLFTAVRFNMVIRQHPIKTLYLAGNTSSHFKPIMDSCKVYKVFWNHLTHK